MRVCVCVCFPLMHCSHVLEYLSASMKETQITISINFFLLVSLKKKKKNKDSNCLVGYLKPRSHGEIMSVMSQNTNAGAPTQAASSSLTGKPNKMTNINSWGQ